MRKCFFGKRYPQRRRAINLNLRTRFSFLNHPFHRPHLALQDLSASLYLFQKSRPHKSLLSIRRAVRQKTLFVQSSFISIVQIFKPLHISHLTHHINPAIDIKRGIVLWIVFFNTECHQCKLTQLRGVKTPWSSVLIEIGIWQSVIFFKLSP